MKYAVCAACAALLAAAGCASSSNQKISSPLLGTVKNEYTIYNIRLESLDDFDRATNIFRRATLTASTNSQSRTGKTVTASLGHGNELFAIDNQVLVGRDIGNATSNAVNASASIPLGF